MNWSTKISYFPEIENLVIGFTFAFKGLWLYYQLTDHFDKSL